jgi:phage terminase large subunit-like protein
VGLLPAEQEKIKQLKQTELKLLQAQVKLKTELPHLHGFPWYKWAKEFFDSVNPMCFLTAGNQLSKSSSQIRKAIDWATDKRKWQKLWPNAITEPNLFWYFYPTAQVATEEFELKWSLFLPQGDMKKDPVYGWTEHYKSGRVIDSIQFNSGVTIIFKTYAQGTQDIQTGTVYAMFLDEECPLSHWPEIQARVNATDGYVSMVFTATLGQEYWRKTIEGEGSNELFPEADKWQITLFDCMEYADGSPSPWSFEKSRRAVARSCSDPANQQAVLRIESMDELRRFTLTLPDSEVQRRILGKFVLVGGRKYEAFRREYNVCKPHNIPSDWLYYGGVDYGSGGESGHPSACLFVAVSPDFITGRVIRGRRADGVLTTAKDLLDIYRNVRGDLKITRQVYDYHCVDFHTYATQAHEMFEKAEKSHDLGVPTVNNLFKMRALQIFDEDPELEKLIVELVTVQATTNKNKAKDDMCDALRYTLMAIPWNWKLLDETFVDYEARLAEPVAPVEIPLREKHRLDFLNGVGSGDLTVDDDIREWNGLQNEFDTY